MVQIDLGCTRLSLVHSAEARMGCIAVRSSVVVRRAAVVIAAVEACLQVCMDRRTPEHWAAAVVAELVAAAERSEQGNKVM